MRDTHWHVVLLEVVIELFGELRCALIQTLLKRGAFILHVVQSGPRRCHDQRLLKESSDEEGCLSSRIGRVAVIPHPAVNSVHEGGLARYHADWHPSSDGFAVRNKVCPDAEQTLSASWVHAETAYDFVENEGCPRPLGDLSQLFQELRGLPIRAATLQRFD